MTTLTVLGLASASAIAFLLSTVGVACLVMAFFLPAERISAALFAIAAFQAAAYFERISLRLWAMTPRET